MHRRIWLILPKYVILYLKNFFLIFYRREDIAMAKTLPARDQVAPEDTWDLSKMYADRESWEADL